VFASEWVASRRPAITQLELLDVAISAFRMTFIEEGLAARAGEDGKRQTRSELATETFPQRLVVPTTDIEATCRVLPRVR
jgi:hypothetical protein